MDFSFGNLIADFFASTWWLLAFIILFAATRSIWLAWRNTLFYSRQPWVLLEIRIPRETTKNPRAMDQVLQAIHALRNAPATFGDKWFQGEVTRPFTFEMVSFGGQTRFYVRAYAKQRNLVEASFYSYYPDIQLIEVEDYLDKFPPTYTDIEAMGNDLWGTEMVLNKDGLYPIKTYLEFESPAEEQQIDPISVFLEVLGKVKKEEFLAIQINASPMDSKDFAKKYESELNDLKKPKIEKVPSGENRFPIMSPYSPGQTRMLEAIERNFTKPVFGCVIRFVYISPKHLFMDSFPKRGVLGAFNQYATNDRNSFRQNFDVSTQTTPWKWPFILPKMRLKLRKQRMWFQFKDRDTGSGTFMGKLWNSHLFNTAFHMQECELSSEELATIFHPPLAYVLTAPHTERMESRRGSAPAGAPIFGEEQEIQEFME